MSEIILILHNIRSAHNVGSLFRTAEGFGVNKIIVSGYTPYPTFNGDSRLPHVRDKIVKQIHKTALGAESMVPFEYTDSLDLNSLRNKGYLIVGLEQNRKSIDIRSWKYTSKIALLVGEEVDGIDLQHLELCDIIIEIPMKGKKESFNVSVAGGIALYEISRHTQ